MDIELHVAALYSATPLSGALVALFSLLIIKDHWSWIFIAGGILPLVLVPLMAVALPESPALLGLRRATALGTRAASASPSGRIHALFSDGKRVQTGLLWACFFLGLLNLYLLLNSLPTLMMQSGLSRAQAGLAQIAFNVGGAFAAAGAGHLFGGSIFSRDLRELLPGRPRTALHFFA